MRRVLIVEDNPRMRRLIASVVAHVADAIDECADGTRALDAYSACPPDCVLMDIDLPGMDGLTATREIVDAFPSARVVIVTGYNGQRLRDAARAAGAAEYVLKDNLADLAGILRRLHEAG
jgi:CheY-like chemotaxis protein